MLSGLYLIAKLTNEGTGHEVGRPELATRVGLGGDGARDVVRFLLDQSGRSETSLPWEPRLIIAAARQQIDTHLT